MRRRPQVGNRGVELGDLIQVIEGLGGLAGPPYAYYGGSAFEPPELPARGAMWLPGHRLATKVPGDRGTVFHANPPFRWSEQADRMREYPAFDDPGYPDWIDPVRGPGPEGLYDRDLTERIYVQPIQARIPTGVVPRMEAAGMHYVIRGKIYPGDVGPSVSGLGRIVTLPNGARIQVPDDAPAAPVPDANPFFKVTQKTTGAAPTWLPWAVGGAAVVGIAAWVLSRRR